MMPLYLILSEIQGKITGPLNIGYSDLYDISPSVKLNKYTEYDAYL